MKTKLILLNWKGSAAVDPRFSASMLPWCVMDIRNRDTVQKLSVGIDSVAGFLEAYNTDFELQFRHQLKHILGMCRMTKKSDGGWNRTTGIAIVHAKGEVWSQTNGMIYLLKDPKDPLLHIHLFESDAIDEVNRIGFVRYITAKLTKVA